jgi:hypothetical protein
MVIKYTDPHTTIPQIWWKFEQYWSGELKSSKHWNTMVSTLCSVYFTLILGFDILNYLLNGGCHGRDRIPVESVPITTKIVSLNPVHGEVYSIQH